MIILAFWGIYKIATVSLSTSAAAVDYVAQQVPNVGKLNHLQTLAWKRLVRDAKRSGTTANDLQAALSDLRDSLNGTSHHPDAVKWYASLTESQKHDVLLVLSGLT